MSQSTEYAPEQADIREDDPAGAPTGAAAGAAATEPAPGTDDGTDPERRGTTLELDAEELRCAHEALQAEIDAAAGIGAEAAGPPGGAASRPAGRARAGLLLAVAALGSAGAAALILGSARG